MNIEKRQGYIQLTCVISFIILAFSISSVLQFAKSTPKSETNAISRTTVEVIRAGPRSESPTIHITGVVSARTVIPIVLQVSGRVESVDTQFFSGGSFTKNTTLFKLDNRDFILQINNADAQVSRAETLLIRAEADQKTALKTWNKKEAPPPLAAREPQLKEAMASVQSANAQRDLAKLALARSQYSLPFNGRVLSSSIAPGQFINAGQSYGQVFDKNSLEIKASLNEQQWQWLNQSNNPNIILNVLLNGSSQSINGKVLRGPAQIHPATRFAEVTFGFDQPTPDILPGAFAQISITTAPLENITKIPAGSLMEQRYVWVVSEDKVIRQLNVTPIFSDEEYIYVQGLSEPENIVITQINGGFEGQEVTVLGARE